jgi:hypothetical protein
MMTATFDGPAGAAAVAAPPAIGALGMAAEDWASALTLRPVASRQTRDKERDNLRFIEIGNSFRIH